MPLFPEYMRRDAFDCAFFLNFFQQIGPQFLVSRLRESDYFFEVFGLFLGMFQYLGDRVTMRSR